MHGPDPNEEVIAGPMPGVDLTYQCGDQLLRAKGARCGLAVIPAGPAGTVEMQIHVAGTDRDVMIMAVAVVDYVRSLGLGDALVQTLATLDFDKMGVVQVVRAAQYESPPEEPS